MCILRKYTQVIEHSKEGGNPKLRICKEKYDPKWNFLMEGVKTKTYLQTGYCKIN